MRPSRILNSNFQAENGIHVQLQVTGESWLLSLSFLLFPLRSCTWLATVGKRLITALKSGTLLRYARDAHLRSPRLLPGGIWEKAPCQKKPRKRAQFPPKGATSIPARGTPLNPGPTAAGWRGPGSCDVGTAGMLQKMLFKGWVFSGRDGGAEVSASVGNNPDSALLAGLLQPAATWLCCSCSSVAKPGLASLFLDSSQGITLLSPFWEKQAFLSTAALPRRAQLVLGSAHRRGRRLSRACTHTHVRSRENGEELILEAKSLLF